jgi:hypothetical protein
MTMAEFGDKYDGDVQGALRGLQKERLTVDVAPLDRNEMKRKWAPVPEEEEHETRKNANSGHARPAKHREWSYLPPLTPILTTFIAKSSRRTSITPEETTPLPSKSRSFPHPSSKDTRHCTSLFYLSIVTVPT